MRILHRHDSVAVAELREAYAAMVEAADRNDASGLSDADQRFHEVLVEASNSTRLRRMASTVLVESRMCMTALERRYQLPGEALREHEQILLAVASGDEAAVRLALHVHMRSAQDLLTPLSPGPDAAAETASSGRRSARSNDLVAHSPSP